MIIFALRYTGFNNKTLKNFITNGEIRKKEKDMKFIPSFSLAYSSKVKQHKEIVQQLSTKVTTVR